MVFSLPSLTPLPCVFWAKDADFGEKNSVFGNRPSVEGGGVPPFSVNFFPLTFRKILVRGGPGGGVPPQRKVSVPGVFDTTPKADTNCQQLLD